MLPSVVGQPAQKDDANKLSGNELLNLTHLSGQ